MSTSFYGDILAQPFEIKAYIYSDDNGWHFVTFDGTGKAIATEYNDFKEYHYGDYFLYCNCPIGNTVPNLDASNGYLYRLIDYNNSPTIVGKLFVGPTKLRFGSINSNKDYTSINYSDDSISSIFKIFNPILQTDISSISGGYRIQPATVDDGGDDSTIYNMAVDIPLPYFNFVFNQATTGGSFSCWIASVTSDSKSITNPYYYSVNVSFPAFSIEGTSLTSNGYMASVMIQKSTLNLLQESAINLTSNGYSGTVAVKGITQPFLAFSAISGVSVGAMMFSD